MPEPFLIFGHRGCPTLQTENTMASFEAALEAGADGFETDLRILSDHLPVLYHDDQLGSDPIESLSSGTVRDRGYDVQPLAELSRFAGTTTMILEVKRKGWEERLVQAVSAWAGIVVASFDHTLIAALHARGVPFPLGLTLFGSIVDLPDYARRTGASWVFPNFKYVEPGEVRELHRAGIRVVPWTPNLPEHWSRLREAGCDGVITDQVADAVRWRDAS